MIDVWKVKIHSFFVELQEILTSGPKEFSLFVMEWTFWEKNYKETVFDGMAGWYGIGIRAVNKSDFP